MATGIRKLHSNGCPSREGGRCRCQAGWEATVYLARERRRVSKTFRRESEARSWRVDALALAKRGALRPPSKTTVQEAWAEWYEGARAGTVLNRSGDPYKPSALRQYEGAMRRNVLPELGALRLADVRRRDLQAFANGLLARGLSPSSVQVALLPLRAIFKAALSRDDLAVDPCAGLQLPAVRGRRERYASPYEAEGLIATVPQPERAIWATAMYAGLRLGELRALRVDDVDLAGGVIHVERGWDPQAGVIALKSRAGRRRVPIVPVLRDYLAEHVAMTGREGADLIFGKSVESPFNAVTLQRHADNAWLEAGLARITPHECRHTFASLMIAAGVNAKALQTFMGHATISITLDRYGHLMPGSEQEAAGLLDSYLAAQRKGAEDAVRAAAVT